jgi:hypothetical protein
MTAVGDIINRAMKDAGVIAAGETAPAEDAADALAALNDIIVQWQANETCAPEAPFVLAPFGSLADPVNLPALYEPALRYSLAEVLLTTFSLPARGDIARLGIKARKLLKRSNLTIPETVMPYPMLSASRYGVYSGDE